MSSKRVTALEEQTELEGGEYLLVDSSDGTFKMSAENLLAEVVASLDISVSGTSLVINTQITDGNEVSY